MQVTSEIDAVRQQAILSSLAGFPAVVGGHFLPIQWVYRTPLYGILGVVVSGGAYLIAALFGEKSIHYTGFFVGATLLVGALLARSRARATWLESRRPTRAHGPA